MPPISTGQGLAMGDAVAVGGTLLPPPTVVSAPTLSASSPVVGAPVVATPGTYTGSPTITRQWFYADTGAPISGATTTSYTPVSADLGHTLMYIETATNASGSVASAAPTTGAVGASSLIPPTSLRTTQDFTTALLAPTAVTPFAAGSGTTGAKEILVDTSTQHQTWLGAGAALTDSACYVLMNNMTLAQRTAFLQARFGADGFGFVRLPMGDCDYTIRNVNGTGAANNAFSVYDNSTTDDGLASISFSQDLTNIIPILNLVLSINPSLKIVVAPWSPPPYFKTTKTLVNTTNSVYYIQNSANNTEYANYFVKYQQFLFAQIGRYSDYSTLQNEPNFNPTGYPGCRFNGIDINALGEAVAAAFSAAGITTMLLSGDTSWGDTVQNSESLSLYPFTTGGAAGAAAFAGAAYHAYDGNASQMAEMAPYAASGKLILHTEHCAGSAAVGSAAFATNWHAFMGDDMIASPYYGSSSLLMWNLALDSSGQPGPADNLQPVANISTTGAVSLTPQYYALAQISSLVKAGAVRVNSTTFGVVGRGGSDVQTVSFLNPDSSVVTVIYNSSSASQTVTIKDQQSAGATTSLTLTAGEVRSVTWKNPASAAAPDAPVIVATPISSTSILINFAGAAPSNNGSAITGYNIYGSLSSGAEALIATNVKFPYLITGLSTATTYYFEAVALNGATPGISLMSAEVSATTAAAGTGPIHYLNLPGARNYNSSCTSFTTNDVTDGYLDVSIWVNLSSYVSGVSGGVFLVSKFLDAGGNASNSEWQYNLDTNGKLICYWENAAGTAQYVASTVTVPSLNPSATTGIWLRMQLNASASAVAPVSGPLASVPSGNVVFSTSADGATWSQLGASVAFTAGGIKALGTSAPSLTIGSNGTSTSNGFLTGKVYKMILLNSAGVILANPDYTLQPTSPSGTSFKDTAATPNSWYQYQATIA